MPFVRRVLLRQNELARHLHLDGLSEVPVNLLWLLFMYCLFNKPQVEGGR